MVSKKKVRKVVLIAYGYGIREAIELEGCTIDKPNSLLSFEEKTDADIKLSAKAICCKLYGRKYLDKFRRDLK